MISGNTAQRPPDGFVHVLLAYFPSVCQKLLDIRQYARVVFDNLTKNLTAQYAHNLCVELP